MASSRTSCQISSNVSTNGLALKTSGSFLSKRAPTLALMRPGCADVTVTRSAR
jgi:hypothetical protein